jgi:hypothetical protein
LLHALCSIKLVGVTDMEPRTKGTDQRTKPAAHVAAEPRTHAPGTSNAQG